MVQENKYYDYLARSGKKIGFDIDDRWSKAKGSLALKVSYFDNHPGELKLGYSNREMRVEKTPPLTGDGDLKTVTLFLSQMKLNSREQTLILRWKRVIRPKNISFEGFISFRENLAASQNRPLPKEIGNRHSLTQVR